MLSLINVEINARLDKFETSMWRAADISEQSMSRAAVNADQFQSAFDRAAIGVGASADRMAGDMEAANDRVINAADQVADSIDRVSQAAEKVDMRSWQEKTAAAFGAGLGAGIETAQTVMDKIEQFAVDKLKIIAIAVLTGVTLGVAGALYTAYESIKWIFGLFTGDSYKSENIDAVIKLNKEVMELQNGLSLSAPAASGLNEALKAVGVSASTYLATMEAAAKSANTNSKELDRLGVAYRSSNGDILSQRQLLENAKKVLDQYTEGYDRNAAAVAIGMGSYQHISDALKVTNEKIDTARQRLIDYNLIIGPGTQEAVSRYEDAMRAFERESDLTSQSFKKAIADNIMPVLTDLAEFFTEGWPTVVNSVRYSMATIASLFYGLKESVQAAAGTVVLSFEAICDVLERVVQASAKVGGGDLSGAWADLKSVPGDLGKHWDSFWADFQAQSDRNLKAMKLAWGSDSWGPDFSSSKPKGKAWKPKPEKKKKDPADPNGYDSFVERLRRENTALEQNEYVMLKVEAAQKAYREGRDATAAMEAIAERQILASNKALKDFSAKLDEENQLLQRKRGAVGLVGAELDIYNMRQQRLLEAMNKINEAERAGKPLTDEARDAVIARAEASAQAAESIIRENEAIERSFSVGAKKAFDTYVSDATNAAKLASDAFGNVFRAGEDAWANFVRTRKLDFRSLADSIITDLARIQARQAMAAAVNAAGGSSGIIGMIGNVVGSLFGSGNVGAGQAVANTASTYSTPIASASVSEVALPSFDVGTDYVPKDMLALIHEGERITPKAFNPTIGDKGVAASGGISDIRVEIVNNGTPQQVDSAAPAFDAQGMIIKVITSDIARDGPIAKTFQRTYGTNRAAGAY